MIDYVGDISQADAGALSRWAAGNDRILEFGMGASTQVLAHYTKGHVTSLDTDEVWKDKTEKHLKRLNIPETKWELQPYSWYLANLGHFHLDNEWDFVFDDGVDHLRRPFGLSVWPFIRVGGWLALHDQRRKHDYDNAMAIIDNNWLEVGTVHFNHAHSNITFIQKKVSEPYDNWQITEKIDMSKW
jgi:predicted O-methyltransferase YrrM